MHVNDFNILLLKLLQENNYKNCRIVYNSANELPSGFLSSMTFVKVCCDSKNEEKLDLHFAVKSSSENETIRDALNIRSIFLQEVYFYEKVLPMFMEFLNEKKVTNILHSFPKCYGTHTEDKNELIILENLMDAGFTLCDRKKTLRLEQLKLTLVEYGKFHALSFTMNDQEPKLFEEVTHILEKTITAHFRTSLYLFIPTLFQQVLNTLQRRNENELYEKLKSLLNQKNIVQQTLDLMEEETSYKIVNHCDSWVNNLMFDYEDEGKTIPSKLAIIDWQLVTVCNSPIYDLSFLLYACASVEDLENLKDLLNVYYKSLYKFMKELGSNPEKVFPYETFLSHWRKYSLFGFMILPMSMKMLYADNEDLPAEVKSVEDTYNWIVNVDLKKKGCEDRIIGLCKQFLSNKI